MKGYISLNQYVRDYRVYLAAKKVDPGREGETMTSSLKKNIDEKLKSSSKSFKKMLKKNKYTNEDLKVLATHEVIGEISDLREFGRMCFGNQHSSVYIRRLLSTNAFKSGKLKKIYEFLPLSIRSKEAFFEFMRSQKSMPKSDLNVVMNKVSEGNWKRWMDELFKDDKLFIRRGSICA